MRRFIPFGEFRWGLGTRASAYEIVHHQAGENTGMGLVVPLPVQPPIQAVLGDGDLRVPQVGTARQGGYGVQAEPVGLVADLRGQTTCGEFSLKVLQLFNHIHVFTMDLNNGFTQ